MSDHDKRVALGHCDATPAASGGTLRKLADLNVRAGPGVSYKRVDCLLRDETTTILGRDQASDWWKIECPPRAEGAKAGCRAAGSGSRGEGLRALRRRARPA